MSNSDYIRPQAKELAKRLKEPRRFIQSISGSRQVGKTTLASQVAERSGLPWHFASVDEPTLQAGAGWIVSQWEEARQLAETSKRKAALLILDEVQKIPQWSSVVKGLWDEDTRKKRQVKVVLLGSAPMLIGRGLAESLAGRFESLHLPHWSFPEMKQAFGWSLKQYLFYGAYPGAASFLQEPRRWNRYIKDSLIETTISRDVLLFSRVDNSALLRRLVEIGCSYSGQIISYRKLAGELEHAGNVTTLSHYLDLLAGVGALAGLRKYTGSVAATRRSIPKIQVFNTALITAQSSMSWEETLADKPLLGRLTESAVGAHLLNAAAAGDCELFYWRDNNQEVDFVVRRGKKLAAIEVKSGRRSGSLSGLDAFYEKFHPTTSLIVGTGGMALERFLSTPVERWLK